MKKILTIFLIICLFVINIYATGMKEDGGLMTISGTNVSTIQFDGTTATEIKAGKYATSTEFDWIYANVANLNINIQPFTDVCIYFNNEYVASRWWLSVYTDQKGIFTEINYHQKDLAEYKTDIPQKEYGGRAFDGLWLSPTYTSGTMLFDKNLNLVLNNRIKYIYEANSTTATNTTYTSWTIIEYSDSEGWCYKGGYLTLYAKWSAPMPRETTTVIIHWGDFSQGINLSESIAATIIHRGDTGFNVTIPVSNSKVKDEKTGLYKSYRLGGLSYDYTDLNKAICKGQGNLNFDNIQVLDLTAYDEDLGCCVWSSSKEFINLYAFWVPVFD